MKRIVFWLLVVMLVSCGKKEKQEKVTSVSKEKKQEVQQHPGKKLLNQQCFLCHNPKSSEKGRMAPPMVEIKAYYINDKTTKEQFTKAMIAFLQKPNEANSKMKDAIERFGVMPYQPYREEDLKKISEYLFEYQIAEPAWFKQYWQKKGGKPYINTGKKG